MKRIESTSTLLILKNYAMLNNLRLKNSHHLNSWASKSRFVIFSIGLCPNPFTSLSWNKEVNKKIQGSILSFPPDVGFIFTCKIATQRLISLLKSGTSLWVPRILLHKNKQIKWCRKTLRKNAMFLIIWTEKR